MFAYTLILDVFFIRMGRTRSQSLISKEGDTIPVTTRTPAASPSSDISDGYLSEELGLELPTRLTSKRERRRETEEERSRRKRKAAGKEKAQKKKRSRAAAEGEDEEGFLQPHPPRFTEREAAVRAASLPVTMEQEKSDNTAQGVKAHGDESDKKGSKNKLRVTVEPVGKQERTMEYMTKTETQVPEEQPSSSTAVVVVRESIF